MKTVTLQSLTAEFPHVVAAARKLEANPQRTQCQRIEASEIRQRLEAQGCGGLLQTAVSLLRDASAPSPGTLTDYQTGETIRRATPSERSASLAAAETDGGSGVIKVDGRSCFVAD